MIAEEIRNIKSGKSDLRKFGISVGIVLSLLGGLFLWREKSYYFYFFILSATLIFPGLAAPTILKPIHKAWMTLAVLLGWLMTRLILIVLFYLIVTPISCLAKLFGEQFLDLKFNKDANSYWIPRKTEKFQRSDYERQF